MILPPRFREYTASARTGDQRRRIDALLVAGLLETVSGIMIA